jgi:hypothetical protein
MVPEVSSIQQIHHQIQVLSVLESIVHIDQEGVVELGEYLSLVHNRLDTALGDDPGFRHLLHSVLLLGLLAVDLPDLPEAALSDAVLVVEVLFGQS